MKCSVAKFSLVKCSEVVKESNARGPTLQNSKVTPTPPSTYNFSPQPTPSTPPPPSLSYTPYLHPSF